MRPYCPLTRPAATLALALALMATLSALPAVAATRYSLKGGVSLATLHGDLPTSVVSNEFRTAGAGGLALTVEGTGAWSFQPELQLVSKGTLTGTIELTDNVGNVIGNVETSLVTDYLEVPLLARVGFRPGETVSPYLVLGPTVGILLSQKSHVSGSISGSYDVNYFRRGDLGLAFGSGFELGSSRYRGIFEARYTVGVTPAANDTYSDNARNGNLMLMAGVSLH